jgi:phosphoesterase RecJ-like protein
MQINPQDLAAFEEAVLGAKRIVLMAHKSPDGDALGAMLSLYLALRRTGKAVTAACVDPVPAAFAFLPGAEDMVREIDPSQYDVVITVDCGDLKQTKFDQLHPELFDGSRTVIKIDHHPFARDFGDIKLVYTDACASCYIMTTLYETLGIKIRPDMATCLLNGLYTDTGSFMHSNTDPSVLRMAARLLRYGANLPTISKSVFHTTPLSSMRLWGRVLGSLKQTREGVTLAVIQNKDFAETGTIAEDLTGVVDWVNAVPHAKFSIMLSERGDLIKASLRTLRDDVNVAKIASAFGGGGHVKAAGFAIPGRLEAETHWRIAPVAEQAN